MIHADEVSTSHCIVHHGQTIPHDRPSTGQITIIRSLVSGSFAGTTTCNIVRLDYYFLVDHPLIGFNSPPLADHPQ